MYVGIIALHRISMLRCSLRSHVLRRAQRMSARGLTESVSWQSSQGKRTEELVLAARLAADTDVKQAVRALRCRLLVPSSRIDSARTEGPA